MLFHEIYGKYYHTVARILQTAAENNGISHHEISGIISESAFSESAMYIPTAMKGNWYLLDKGGKSVLRNPLSRPLTLTEKRWMKAILLDPRIKLFEPYIQGLEDVQPLFAPDMFCWFDRYEDGDPFEDPVYIQNFKQAIQGIAQKRKMKILYSGANGAQEHICTPYRLEYSEKDDKFRLLSVQRNRQLILNMAKVLRIDLLEEVTLPIEIPVSQKKKLVFELRTQRNALERAMLHFSHLEKETVQLEKGKYSVTLWYEPRDEREVLIRILSFGPMLKVIEPESLVSQIANRIQKQKNLRTL